MRWLGPPDEPDRYEIEADLSVAVGAQGAVWEGRRISDGRRVALKQLIAGRLDWDEYRELLLALGSSDRTGIVRTIDAFKGCYPYESDVPAEEDFDYQTVVSCWVAGTNLDEAYQETSAGTGLAWLPDLAVVLQELHSFRHDLAPNGLVHLDLRPRNIRIQPDSRPVILDLGHLHPLGRPWAGTPTGGGWCPFELGHSPAHPIGEWTDGWAIAALGFWMLVGQPPGILAREAAEEQLTVAAQAQAIPSSRRVARLLAQMLTVDPKARPSVRRWGELLRAALTGRHRRRQGALAAVAGVSLLVSAVVIGVDRLGPNAVSAVPPNQSSPQSSVSEITLTVSNLVTSGSAMIEDRLPANLSYRPQNFCCAVAGTEMRTEDRLHGVVCFTIGDRTTNGNDGDPGDDQNPSLADSSIWYGSRLPDGAMGYISEVWIHKSQRGGVDLPQCSALGYRP